MLFSFAFTLPVLSACAVLGRWPRQCEFRDLIPEAGSGTKRVSRICYRNSFCWVQRPNTAQTTHIASIVVLTCVYLTGSARLRGFGPLAPATRVSINTYRNMFWGRQRPKAARTTHIASMIALACVSLTGSARLRCFGPLVTATRVSIIN